MGNRRRWLRWIKASTKIEYFGSLVQPNQILDSFEQAQSTGNKEEHRRLMTFAIVGGGGKASFDKGLPMFDAAAISLLLWPR